MSLPDNRTLPAKRHSKLLLFFLSTLGCAGSSLIAEQVYVAAHEGFGAGDIWAFAFWLAQLSIVVGIVALALGTLGCRSWFRHTLSIFVGLVGGYVWTWFVYFTLGPWFGAFSFPVLHFWMLGAVVGLLIGGVYVSFYRRGANEVDSEVMDTVNTP